MSAMLKKPMILVAVPAVLYLVLCVPGQTAQNSNDARSQLYSYIDGIARTHIQKRQERIAQIVTRDAAERRKSETREKILRLIGGLPEHTGSVAVKEFGSVPANGFRVEKIAYESLPGFWVTADLYRPAAGDGPFPAIVLAPGHGAGGKTENWSWGGNFARNGIVALAYDPIGQGERLQYYDPERKVSFIGNPTGEHGEANIGPMLLGDDIARYMVNDAMRGVDYLSARKDVDASRIGAFGCSGGGTMTAYFAALDDRVKAAAVACYFTSFTELLASPQGAQDAEQSIPHFIEQGMDFPDWAEAFAPKPYAVISTENDMFPFAGARTTVDEARRFYGLYGAAEKLEWITGPGGHGNLGPISPAILSFFTKNLKGAKADPEFTPLRPTSPADMTVTPSGQVSTSIGGETIYSLNRKRAEMLSHPTRPVNDRSALQQRRSQLQKDISELTRAVFQPETRVPPESMTTKSAEQHSRYRLETISLKSDADTQAPGTLAIPDGPGAKRAVLILSPQPPSLAEIEELAKANYMVLALQPRPTPAGTESLKSPYLGVFNLLSLRAFLVGKTLLGLRVDDAIRAVNVLAARTDVDRRNITAYGSGPMGLALLHAAVLDARISRLVLDSTLTSYRMIVDQPVHRNVSEVVVPGVLQRYDTGDLLEALFPRPVTIVSPRDALGEPVSEDAYRAAMSAVFESDRKLGSPARIRFATDGLRAIVQAI
jgi:cephalosporin-C deacetylase-like acetyl esterase